MVSPCSVVRVPAVAELPAGLRNSTASGGTVSSAEAGLSLYAPSVAVTDDDLAAAVLRVYRAQLEAERVGIAMRLGGQVTPRWRRGRHGLRDSESLARRQRPHRALGPRVCDVDIARHGLGHGKRIHLAAVVVAKGVGEHGIRVVLGRAALEGEGRRRFVGGAGGHRRRHAT